MTQLAGQPTARSELAPDGVAGVLARRLVAEALGTGLLVVAVVGSGTMATRLSADVGVQLLANAAATAAALVGLILILAAVSGAHFNPVVTLVDRGFGAIGSRDAGLYIAAQVAGGCLGTVVANLMFELPAVEWSTKDRSSGALWFSEVVATVGLLLAIHGCVRSGRRDAVAFAVGLWIGGAYWFTSSTSFANPAVTVARTLTDSFTGIAPASAPMFIVMQLAGGAVAFVLVRFLYPTARCLSTPSIDPDLSRKEPHMPDLADLSLDQQLALRSAAANLHREFDGVFGTETIELFLATSYDQFAGQARIPTYLVLIAERFARQRLKALATVEGKHTDGIPIVLFLCTHNAGRSQVALGWFNHLADNRAVAWSGGSEPGTELNPAAVAAMAEVGIDITGEFPKPWTDEIVKAADVVVTMGCGDACPLFPGKRYEDWELDDPAGQPLEAVRPIRDEIRDRVEALLASVTAS